MASLIESLKSPPGFAFQRWRAEIKYFSRTAKLFTDLSHLAPHNRLGEEERKGKKYEKAECFSNAIKCAVDVKGGLSHTLALLHEVVGRCIVVQYVQDFLLELPLLDIGRRCGFRPLED